jgi:hypothetical protein
MQVIITERTHDVLKLAIEVYAPLIEKDIEKLSKEFNIKITYEN